eukprot:scaffold165353_cov29-Tisochrysis_lutea.AAC.2
MSVETSTEPAAVSSNSTVVKEDTAASARGTVDVLRPAQLPPKVQDGAPYHASGAASGPARPRAVEVDVLVRITELMEMAAVVNLEGRHQAELVLAYAYSIANLAVRQEAPRRGSWPRATTCTAHRTVQLHVDKASTTRCGLERAAPASR